MAETREGRVTRVRALVEERHAAHRRLGLPRVDLTLNALDRLGRVFKEHPEGAGWCRRCREDTPCAEVRAAETLLWVVEKTETEGLENGAG